MSDYDKEIVRLVTEECAKGVGHRKVLEPLCNMMASVVAGIKAEHGEDLLPWVKSQLDKMFEQYEGAYAAKSSKH